MNNLLLDMLLERARDFIEGATLYDDEYEQGQLLVRQIDQARNWHQADKESEWQCER